MKEPEALSTKHKNFVFLFNGRFINIHPNEYNELKNYFLSGEYKKWEEI